MLIRRERQADQNAVHSVHHASFHHPDHPKSTPFEAGLVDDLRASYDWLPTLSLVAVAPTEIEPVTTRWSSLTERNHTHDADPAVDEGPVIGHIVCSRGWIGDFPALGLGPTGVLPEFQHQGVGSALMHAVLGAADALGEGIVGLLGAIDYYVKFGFEPASHYGIISPVPEWQPVFQVRPLSMYDARARGTFRYSEPFGLFDT